MLTSQQLEDWEREAQACGSPGAERVVLLISEVRRLRGVIESSLPEVEKLIKLYGRVARLSFDGLLENLRLKSSKHGPTNN
jgi:hypothetical protein